MTRSAIQGGELGVSASRDAAEGTVSGYAVA